MLQKNYDADYIGMCVSIVSLQHHINENDIYLLRVKVSKTLFLFKLFFFKSFCIPKN